MKTLDTEEAAKSLAPHLAPSAAVISLQNGVDNVERIRSAAKIDAFAAVVYVAAAMTAPGRVKHPARGDLILGDLPGRGEEGGIASANWKALLRSSSAPVFRAVSQRMWRANSGQR